MFKSFKSQNKKILIIGRKHIKKYIKRVGLDIADCYYVENRYVLYVYEILILFFKTYVDRYIF